MEIKINFVFFLRNLTSSEHYNVFTMKTSIYIFLSLLLLLNCNENKSPTTTDESTNKQLDNSADGVIEGNWEMVGYYNYRDNKITDSFKTNEGYRQVKMFNKNKVMWSKLVPSDSIEWFGYGSYQATDSTLTEKMHYGSKVMNSVIAAQEEFSYKLVITKDKFSQIRVDDDGEMIYAENYIRIN
jgi:hypothetical protein